ncbi:hypothetical protein PVK06_023528 [Gossypium arboreum]|uniref:Uncharacterized protein n=1 Tax=Gossypium arboreum TaxID=29729 RepID=A0ABR0PBK5_GOSAR|nr:hypothetical protein PVK06_023528 [Gossypium arboreum]
MSLERPGSLLSLDLERAAKKVWNRDHGENNDYKMVLDESLSKRVSYKEMLMNRSDLESEFDNKDDDFLDNDAISIHEDDVEICLEGYYTNISFSECVHELIDQSMKKTLIVCFFGKNNRIQGSR